jgi:3-oxoacyl-[acyl-carrier protein] reductase
MSGVEGRVALITGAAQGIGEGIARRLAAGGAAVAVLDLRQDEVEAVARDINATGGKAIAFCADVSSREEAERAVETTVRELGSVDILVNNAGVIRDNLLFKMTDSDWSTVMAVHLGGAFLMTQAAQKHMVPNKYGRIINLSSTSALGNRGQANYSAAKAGIQGFTKTIAIELGPYGITANAVAPGFTETAMTKASAERAGKTIEEWRAEFASTLPVRRGGVPADIAHAVAFFAAEEAGYVTGQVVYVDGGSGLL